MVEPINMYIEWTNSGERCLLKLNAFKIITIPIFIHPSVICFLKMVLK